MSPVVPFRPEIRQRMAELQQLIEESENQGNIGEMRRQIDMLTEENERLATMSQPPAYGDDETDSNPRSTRMFRVGSRRKN